MDRLKKAGALFIPLFIILLVMLSIWSFYSGVRSDIESSAYKTLEESARQKSASILSALNGKYATLETFSNTIVRFYNRTDQPEIQALAETCADTNGFYLIGISDDGGSAYTSRGFSVYVGDRAYFSDALSGKRGLERVTAAKRTTSPRTLLSVPIRSESGVEGVAFGSFEDAVFSDIINNNTYRGMAYSFITDSEGNFIFGSESMPYDIGENILTYLTEKVRPESKDTVENVQSVMSENGNGTFFVRSDTGRRFVCYMPLGLSDWYLFAGVPENAATKTNAKLTNRSTILTLEILLTSAVAIWYTMAVKSRQNKRLAEEKEQLRISEERYRLVGELSDTILFEGNLSNDTITFNEHYKNLYGRQPFVTKISQLRLPNPHVLPEDMCVYNDLYRQIIEGSASGFEEYRIAAPSGALVWHRFEYRTLFDQDGKPERIIGRISDVSEKHRLLQHLKTEAETDALTQVLNRKAIETQIDAFLAAEGRNGMHALLLLDVDDFKQINDTMGHISGDQALKGIAGAMASAFRSTDLIGRLGGDEFIAFIKDVRAVETVAEKARSLCFISLSNGDDHAAFEVSISIGISMYDRNGTCFHTLYQCADAALYQAKALGKGCFKFGEAGKSEQA